MSVAPVDFGAPPAPRPAWFPAAALLLADAPATEVLAWAVGTFGSDLSVACSMQDGVLVDLTVRADPDVEVVFLDTGFHFPETLETARRLQRRYDLNLVTLRPGHDAALYGVDGTEACCEARKVVPLDRHLAQRSAWVTGLRRAESPSRAGAATLEWDAGRGVV
ncbi:MAG: phosphoadenosine phosphosulfate reductase family protein, partial [Actinobacteria bacterium]|nr:phosphoadenosine phosphosulfate reductase family protein [Actinomycetota bacterium]